MRYLFFLVVFFFFAPCLRAGQERLSVYVKTYNSFLAADQAKNFNDASKFLHQLIELYIKDENNNSLLQSVQNALSINEPLYDFLEKNFQRFKPIVDKPQEINAKLRQYMQLQKEAAENIGKNNKVALEKIESAEELVEKLAEMYETIKSESALKEFIFKSTGVDRAQINSLYAQLDRLKSALGKAITADYIAKDAGTKFQLKKEYDDLIKDLPKLEKKIEKLRQDNFDLADALQAFKQEPLRKEYVRLFADQQLQELDALTGKIIREHDAYLKEHPVQPQQPKPVRQFMIKPRIKK